MRGDYNWAVNQLSKELGKQWKDDPWGRIMLQQGLYDRGVSRSYQHASYNYLSNYLRTEYDYNLEEDFDWEAYQEWYESLGN